MAKTNFQYEKRQKELEKKRKKEEKLKRKHERTSETGDTPENGAENSAQGLPEPVEHDSQTEVP